MFHIIDLWGGVVVVDRSPIVFNSEEDAQQYARDNMQSWQVIEGNLRESDVYRSQQGAVESRTTPAT